MPFVDLGLQHCLGRKRKFLNAGILFSGSAASFPIIRHPALISRQPWRYGALQTPGQWRLVEALGRRLDPSWFQYTQLSGEQQAATAQVGLDSAQFLEAG